jgi:hypothetical protein
VEASSSDQITTRGKEKMTPVFLFLCARAFVYGDERGPRKSMDIGFTVCGSSGYFRLQRLSNIHVAFLKVVNIE